MKKDYVPPRELVNICDKENFKIILRGNKYCKIGLGTKKIDCPRQSKIKDANGLYPCLDIREDDEEEDYSKENFN